LVTINDIYTIMLLSLTLILIVLNELTRKRKIDFLLVFNFSYAILFCIVPIIVLIYPDLLSYGTPANWAYHFAKYQDILIVSGFYTLFFYVVFMLFYKYISKKKFISGKTKEKVKLRTQQFDGQDKLFLAGIAFLIFGIISFFIYSSTMGGPINAIKYAQLKRSGVFETTGALTFFKHFMKSVYFALFVFLTIKPKKKSYKAFKNILLFISIIFTIIVLMAYSGRANIIILLATLLFYKNVLNNTILINKKQIILYMVIIIILGLISGYFRPFMLLISGRELVFDTGSSFMLMFSSIIKYFSVPITSLMVAIQEFSFNEIRMGLGFLLVFLDIIPKSIIDPELIFTVNNMNTELFGFASEGYNIPAGLLAYFYYEFYWLGIIIGGIITAIVIKIFDDVLDCFRFNDTFGIMIVYFLIGLPIRIISGDQVGGIKSYLILYIEFIILYIVIITMKGKRKKEKSEIIKIE
jgi:oligosaccharide repeat unit polymerase